MGQSKKNIYRVTGIMSGTSLDGMDMAACEFENQSGKWNYKLLYAETYPYTAGWTQRLRSLRQANAREAIQAHYDYGRLIAGYVNKFHEDTGFKPLIIASHGHTVFHNPIQGYSWQTGSGAAIATLCGIPAVCDFRSTDICLGGQGAPLVPIGDELLFGDYDACLNLGGFSNISLKRSEKRIAFDICPVNTVLNLLASEAGMDFDRDGTLAQQGKIITGLLDSLNMLPFYKSPPPKSLGAEWLEENVFPLFNDPDYGTKDKLRTFTEHIAQQIKRVVGKYGIKRMLVTGGGAYNKFLIQQITYENNCQLVIPEHSTVDYKEALIFAFLGLLRWIGLPNCLATVTGAESNSIAGAVYLPVK